MQGVSEYNCCSFMMMIYVLSEVIIDILNRKTCISEDVSREKQLRFNCLQNSYYIIFFSYCTGLVVKPCKILQVYKSDLISQWQNDFKQIQKTILTQYTNLNPVIAPSMFSVVSVASLGGLIIVKTLQKQKQNRGPCVCCCCC